MTRRIFWMLIALAGTAGAQWRHFGEERTASVQSSLERDMLAGHNSVRARVGVAPLTWSDRLARVAQEWASTLLARRQFAHRQNSTLGENLFEISGAAATPARVLDAWVGEGRNYNLASNTCRGVCGHYTQIVWSGTREVGCAVARGGRTEVWVCEYDPPGNVVGTRPY